MAQIEHHQIVAKLTNDDDIHLEQTDCGESYSVLLGKWQLREICEQFGIIASDRQAERQIKTLERRLRVLNDRIEYLAHYLANHSDHKHADLSFEQTYATATADIAAEFVAELEDDAQGVMDAPKQAAERTKQTTGTDTRQLSIEV